MKFRPAPNLRLSISMGDTGMVATIAPRGRSRKAPEWDSQLMAAVDALASAYGWPEVRHEGQRRLHRGPVPEDPRWSPLRVP